MSERAWWTRRRTIIAVVAGALVLAVVITAIAMSRRSGTEPTAGPTASTSVGATATAAPTAAATETSPPAPAASSAAAGGSSDPTASPSRIASPYCQQYQQILAGGTDTTEDDGSVNLDELSDTFAELITKYTKASELAPKKLKPAYAKVIARLESMKKAVDSRDIDKIKTMLSQLTSLNNSMDEIQQVSKQICG